MPTLPNAPRRNWTPVGLGDRLHHYPTQLSGGEQQRVALARALAPDPAILVADEPTGNLDEATGKQIVDLLFTKHAERGMTLVLVTHDTSLAQRCDRVVRWRSGRIDGISRLTTIADETAIRPAHRRWRFVMRSANCAAACAASTCSSPASRSACWRLPASVRFAASLGEGLAREGRTLLGGDVAFSLIQREAKPDEVAFLRSRGEVSVAATLRAMARAGDGRLALVELKAVDGNYPMLGELTLEPKMPVADLLAEHDGVFGAAVDSTLLARFDLKLGDRVSVGNATFQFRSVVATEPDKLAGNVGLGPRFLTSDAGLRAPGCCSPAAWLRWIYRVKLPDNASDDRAATGFISDAPHRRAASRLGNSQPRQRFPQLERTIKPLYAISDPGRACSIAGRRLSASPMRSRAISTAAAM